MEALPFGNRRSLLLRASRPSRGDGSNRCFQWGPINRASSVGAVRKPPLRALLHQPHPSTEEVNYALLYRSPLWVPDGAETVDVAIYNLLGQLVRQVWSGPLAAGEHRLTWDGRDGQGQPVASGAYLYQLRVGDELRTRKMVKLE